MKSLCNFNFYSLNNIDGNKEEISFVAKGYKDIDGLNKVYYFKNENNYKFIVLEDCLEVHVNESIYKFELNKKTKALIKVDKLLYKTSINTTKLEISDSKIVIEYTMSFGSFDGEYLIILELL